MKHDRCGLTFGSVTILWKGRLFPLALEKGFLLCVSCTALHLCAVLVHYFFA